MPLYRFRLTGEDQERPFELADDEAAWAHLVASCKKMLAEMDEHLPTGRDWEITAIDERGQDVASIRIVASRRRR